MIFFFFPDVILADPGSKSTSVFPFTNSFIFFPSRQKTLNIVVSFSYLELPVGLVKDSRYMEIIYKVDTV